MKIGSSVRPEIKTVKIRRWNSSLDGINMLPIPNLTDSLIVMNVMACLVLTKLISLNVVLVYFTKLVHCTRICAKNGYFALAAHCM